MPRILCCAVCLLSGLGLAGESSDFKPLTERQRRLNLESFAVVWSTVRDQHWDPRLGGVDWKSARIRTLPEIRKAPNMAETRAALTRMLDLLGQSHFAIIPSELYNDIQSTTAKRSPGNETSEPPKDATPDRVEECGTGVAPGVVDGKAIVIAVEPDSPAARLGIRPGWWIESIQGIPTAHILQRLSGSKIREREALQVAVLESWLSGPIDESVETEFTDGAGERKRLAVSRLQPKGSLARFGNLPPVRVWIETRKIAGEIGYVRFNAFLDPENLMPQFETAVRGCLHCKGFIVDLRGNPGGIGVMSMGMAGWFISRRGQRLGTLQTREMSWDFEIFPRPETFGDPLAILVDGGSASTAEIFADGLKELGRARVFGVPTAAAALPSTVIKLPNGDGFQYVNANYTSRGGKPLEGNGVKPDVVVRHTREALLAGHDLPLDAAVEWIQRR